MRPKFSAGLPTPAAGGFAWRRTAADAYISDQSVCDGDDNFPGAVVYERDGDTILRKNACVFGPGDLYCAMWSLLGLAGIDDEDWTPQFSYWNTPFTSWTMAVRTCSTERAEQAAAEPTDMTQDLLTQATAFARGGEP